VIELHGDKKQVVVGDSDALFSDTMLVRKLNWVAVEALTELLHVAVKIRNRHEPAAAVITPEGDAVRVQFEQPQRAITPGQAAVFYDGDVVVGGGWIG
jgi:tRNA-specific 2-thiouridylase